MAKDDQQEAYEKTLSASYTRVMDAQKFAETKNAALLTFCSAWILATVNIVSSNHDAPYDLSKFALIALPFFAGGALFAIKSILPRTLLTRFDPTKADKNLVYFGDIAELEPVAFRAQVRARYFPAAGQTATDAYLGDLATQISVNSRITLRKHQLFERGAITTLIGILIIIVPLAIEGLGWFLSRSIVQAAIAMFKGSVAP